MRPSRSSILPRGASTGTSRMRLSSAICSYLPLPMICSFHSRNPSASRIPKMTYWKTASFAPLTFSRSRPNTGAVVAISASLLQTVQLREQQRTDHCVCECAVEFPPRLVCEVVAHDARLDKEAHRIMQELKYENGEEPRSELLHLQLHADGRADVSDDGVCYAVESYRQPRNRVLHDTDHRARHRSRQSIAARHREVDSHQQRQIEIREQVQPQWHVALQQDRQRGHDEARDQSELAS